MSRLDRYLAVACQWDRPSVRHRDGIAANIDRMIEMTRSAVAGYRPLGRVGLVAFPEFAWSPPTYFTAEELAEHLALPADNPHTERLTKVATDLGIVLVCGSFLEHDPKWPDAVFNTTLAVGEGRTLLRYRKVHPWIPWEVHASPHDLEGYDEPLFPVADTPMGKIGVATCYDWLFPESTRELALGGAEVLVRVSAYMDPWGATPPMDWWTLVNRCRAMENLCHVVAANQGASLAHYPPFSWPGGSMLVDFDGRILAQADPGPGEKMVVASIDLAAQRAARSERSMHQMILHRRPEAYGRASSPGFPPSRTAKDRTIDALERTIARLKRGETP